MNYNEGEVISSGNNGITKLGSFDFYKANSTLDF